MTRLRRLACILASLGLVLVSLAPLHAQTTPASGVRIQQGGVEQGRATIINCSTGVTCTLPVGSAVVEVEATGGGGSPGGSSGDLQTNNGAGGFGGFAGDSCPPGEFATDIGTDGTLTCAAAAGGGTVTNTGTLTANRLILGNGGVDVTAHGSLGTTTTVLHGNAGGAPSFGAVVSADMNITTTSCTNQFVTAISAGGVGTCTTSTLASAQYANQGTTTTVLHGNAAGNPSFGPIVGNDITNGTIGLGKLANQADDTILSNVSGGAAAPVANTLTDVLDNIIGSTQGAIVYRDAAAWARLDPGTSGQFLQTQGAGANPQWSTPSGSGDVSSNTATSVDSEVALFSGTSGKLIKRATGTGVARVASGVLSAAELSGDVTTSGSNATTIANNAVTTAKVADANITKAKIENVAADKLLGRGNGGGAGAPQEITLGTNLSMSGTTLNAAGGSSILSTQALGSNATVASTTGAEVAGLAKTTGTGVFKFEYWLAIQTETTGNGCKFGVNHDGTATLHGVNLRFAGSAATADQLIATPQAFPGAAARAFSTTSPNLGPTTGTDTANATVLYIIEGLINVSVDGNLELWMGSETSDDCTAMADSSLILTKTN